MLIGRDIPKLIMTSIRAIITIVTIAGNLIELFN
jgi:hypothetical protein